MKTRFLITGGAGFIGSNLIKRLLTKPRNEVVCLDNLDDFYSRQIKIDRVNEFLKFPNFSFIKGDIRSRQDIEKACRVDVIVHLAAKAGVQFGIAYPQACLANNVSGTLELLNYARDQKIQKFIFASSSSVYGASASFPWSEDQQVKPINPYGCSKVAAEMLGYSYAQLYNINFLALRFFSVYGPGQRPDLVISKFFDLISKELPIRIYGDGTTSRDYTYISDVVDSFIQGINFDIKGFETINIGCGSPVLLRDIVIEIERLLEKSAVIEWDSENRGEATSTYAALDKAHRILNYQPKINIYEGLLSYYNSKNDMI